MPIVLQVVPEDRLILSWPQPHIVVDRLVDLEWLATFADRCANAVAIDATTENFSEQGLFLMQELLEFQLAWIGALLRTDLANALVLAKSDRLIAFPLGMRQRLFDVDIFPGLHGPNRG